MLGYITSSTEWLQQHAVHLLLRRNMAHLFEDPLDLDQLKVQLRRHQLHPCMEWTARLTNVRVSRAAIGEHLVRCQGWRERKNQVHTPDILARFIGASDPMFARICCT